MMGADCERIFSGIESVRSAAQSAVISFSASTAYQITSRAQHAGMGSGECTPTEREVPVGNPMTGVSAAMSAMSGDVGNMAALGSSLYTTTGSFNNSVGSPWTEIANLQSAVSSAEAYAGSHAPFNYVGEKAGMLAMLNMVLSAAVDAKWALATYHDYVQRGYDNVYNGNNPSITFQETVVREGIGNVKQDYDENVNVPPESIDPF